MACCWQKRHACQLQALAPSLEKFNHAHFGVFSPRKAWKSSNTLILEFSAREKLKMRAIELSPRPPSPEPGKVQKRSFWSFQPAKSSKCPRLNFTKGRPSPSLEKRSFRSFQPAKSSKCARLNFPQIRPSPSLEKLKARSFWSFQPAKSSKCARLNFPRSRPFPEPGKVQTRSFWSCQPAKSSKCPRFNSPQGRPSPSLEGSNALILEFSAREKLKMRAFELSPRPPFPEPGKVKSALILEFSARQKSQNARD